jgi:hypothetical protein
MPSFEVDKAVLSFLLDLELVEDPTGRARLHVSAPPVLPPFNLSAARALFASALFSVLPVKEVCDQEYQNMQELNPPMTITMHRCVTALPPLVRLQRCSAAAVAASALKMSHIVGALSCSAHTLMLALMFALMFTSTCQGCLFWGASLFLVSHPQQSPRTIDHQDELAKCAAMAMLSCFPLSLPGGSTDAH